MATLVSAHTGLKKRRGNKILHGPTRGFLTFKALRPDGLIITQEPGKPEQLHRMQDFPGCHLTIPSVCEITSVPD